MKTTNLTSPHAPPLDYLRPKTYVPLSAIFYKVKVLHPVLTTKTVKQSKIFCVNIYYISIYRKLCFFFYYFFYQWTVPLKKVCEFVPFSRKYMFNFSRFHICRLYCSGVSQILTGTHQYLLINQLWFIYILS